MKNEILTMDFEVASYTLFAIIVWNKGEELAAKRSKHNKTCNFLSSSSFFAAQNIICSIIQIPVVQSCQNTDRNILESSGMSSWRENIHVGRQIFGGKLCMSDDARS
jgi:hypothetical protein